MGCEHARTTALTRPPPPRWRAAAQAGLVVAAAGLIGAGETPASRFAPPLERPMVLSRTLTRDLGGGNAIVATRRYRIAFHRVETGWRIDGELIASEIEAPAPLAALAAIERARPDDGLFPILLDAEGRIVARDALPPAQGRGEVDRAIAIAPTLPGVAPVADPAFLAQLRTAAGGGGLTRWPAGLFQPGAGRNEAAQEIVLPSGASGVVRVTLEQTPAPGGAIMARAQRTVTTELGGSRRVAREAWTIAAESPDKRAR